MMKSPIIKLLLIVSPVPCFIALSNDCQEKLFQLAASSPEFLNALCFCYGLNLGFLFLLIPLSFLNIIAFLEEVFDHYMPEDSAYEVEQ